MINQEVQQFGSGNNQESAEKSDGDSVNQDAPELKQPQGIASRDHLRMLLNQAGNRVKVRAVDTDRFGRTVADLYTDSGLVQLQQTRAGWVWANTKYKSDCREWRAISAAEQEARRARRGIWAGNPMPPWEWRRRNR